MMEFSGIIEEMDGLPDKIYDIRKKIAKMTDDIGAKEYQKDQMQKQALREIAQETEEHKDGRTGETKSKKRYGTVTEMKAEVEARLLKQTVYTELQKDEVALQEELTNLKMKKDFFRMRFETCQYKIRYMSMGLHEDDRMRRIEGFINRHIDVTTQEFLDKLDSETLRKTLEVRGFETKKISEEV